MNEWSYNFMIFLRGLVLVPCVCFRLEMYKSQNAHEAAISKSFISTTIKMTTSYVVWHEKEWVVCFDFQTFLVFKARLFVLFQKLELTRFLRCNRKKVPPLPLMLSPKASPSKHVIQLQTLVCPLFFVSVAIEHLAGLIGQGAAVSLPF